jgi:arachidonate 15-lipoxygenase (second type)/8-lipoxygenase (S-type)
LAFILTCLVTPELFAYRQVALEVLIRSGGYIDRLFAFSGNAAAQTTSDLYNTGISSAFQANYFYENLASRGLINTTHGSRIKHFPFFEDASVIYTAIQAFMTTFIDSYYTHPSMFAQDEELQAWMLESVPADIIDFPKSADRRTLVDILTHIAFLGSAVHQTLNTNDISEASGSLPFHPFALYQPIPIAKGVEDIIPFLPNITQSIGQIGLTALFARPEYVNSNRSLTQMFNDGIMLARMNKKTAEAARLFQAEMKKFSKLVSSRTFDAQGLCQGMPFIWKALDPERSPYYLTI